MTCSTGSVVVGDQAGAAEPGEQREDAEGESVESDVARSAFGDYVVGVLLQAEARTCT